MSGVTTPEHFRKPYTPLERLMLIAYSKKSTILSTRAAADSLAQTSCHIPAIMYAHRIGATRVPALFDGNTIGIIIATFTGPVAPVIVLVKLIEYETQRKEEFDVFRTMMRLRRMPLSADYVDSLNLVGVEFHRQKKVMLALKDLMNHFDDGYGMNKTVDELKSANDKSDALRTSLLSAMANSLGYHFEQMEIHRGGYAPQGWMSELDEQNTTRRGLSELLSGRRTLPIEIVAAEGNAIGKANRQQPIPHSHRSPNQRNFLNRAFTLPIGSSSGT